MRGALQSDSVYSSDSCLLLEPLLGLRALCIRALPAPAADRSCGAAHAAAPRKRSESHAAGRPAAFIVASRAESPRARHRPRPNAMRLRARRGKRGVSKRWRVFVRSRGRAGQQWACGWVGIGVHLACNQARPGAPLLPHSRSLCGHRPPFAASAPHRLLSLPPPLLSQSSRGPALPPSACCSCFRRSCLRSRTTATVSESHSQAHSMARVYADVRASRPALTTTH